MNRYMHLISACVLALAIFGCSDSIAPAPAGQYSIAGFVRNGASTGIPGVTITAGSATTTTASDGGYSFTGLTAGEYTVSAARNGLMFEPASRHVVLSSQSVLNVDFATFVTMEMVSLPGGTFTMGASGTTSLPEERLAHQVTLSPFAIGKYEVTQKQWLFLMGNNPSAFIGDSNPVERVSWYDAVAFCNRLSQAEGLTQAYVVNGDATTCNFNANGYRLPTEAEREYACRAGTTTDFYSGNMTIPGRSTAYADSNLDRIAWYGTNSDSTTHPVGLKQPNAFGLYDMSGNVTEWCWDWTQTSFAAGSVIDPVGPATNPGTGRTTRGGSYDPKKYVPLWNRSAFRYAYLPSSKFDGIGFRVVRSMR